MIELGEFVDSLPYCLQEDFLQGLCHRLEKSSSNYSDSKFKNEVIGILEKLRQRAQNRYPAVETIPANSLENLSASSTQAPEILPYWWDRMWPISTETRLLKEARSRKNLREIFQEAA